MVAANKFDLLPTQVRPCPWSVVLGTHTANLTQMGWDGRVPTASHCRFV